MEHFCNSPTAGGAIRLLTVQLEKLRLELVNGRDRIYTQAVWPVRALISPTCPLPRGAVVNQVVHAWDRGPAGVQGWEGPGCAGGLPAATWVGLLCGPESQPCILGSWLCLEHLWGLSHSRAHPTTLPTSYLGPQTWFLDRNLHFCLLWEQERGTCLLPQKHFSTSFH